VESSNRVYFKRCYDKQGLPASGMHTTGPFCRTIELAREVPAYLQSADVCSVRICSMPADKVLNWEGVVIEE
jgi:hypothetical protein